MAGVDHALSEHESKQLLARFGLVTAREVLVGDPDAAVVAAAQLGFPVVAKLCGATVLHKTELGAVRLGLADEAAVRQATRELLASAPLAAAPLDAHVQILIAEQVRGTRELIAGLATDPVFGPTIMLGIGGILAEVVADVTFRLLPAPRSELASMADDLATQALLGPFRGEPEVDRGALTDALEAIATCAAAHPEIASIDLNPLIISDGRPIAVDALVVLSVSS